MLMYGNDRKLYRTSECDGYFPSKHASSLTKEGLQFIPAKTLSFLACAKDMILNHFYV